MEEGGGVCVCVRWGGSWKVMASIYSDVNRGRRDENARARTRRPVLQERRGRRGGDGAAAERSREPRLLPHRAPGSSAAAILWAFLPGAA